MAGVSDGDVTDVLGGDASVPRCLMTCFCSGVQGVWNESGVAGLGRLAAAWAVRWSSIHGRCDPLRHRHPRQSVKRCVSGDGAGDSDNVGGGVAVWLIGAAS